MPKLYNCYTVKDYYKAMQLKCLFRSFRFLFSKISPKGDFVEVLVYNSDKSLNYDIDPKMLPNMFL